MIHGMAFLAIDGQGVPSGLMCWHHVYCWTRKSIVQCRPTDHTVKAVGLFSRDCSKISPALPVHAAIHRQKVSHIRDMKVPRDHEQAFWIETKIVEVS